MAQLLIFVGLVLLSVIVGVVLSAGVVAIMLGPDAIGNVSIMSDLQKPAIVSTLKVSQFFASLATFILPVLIFVYLSSRKGIAVLGLHKTISFKTGLTAFVLVLAVLPIVNFTQEINQMMQLPAFLVDLEVWMKQQEENTEVIITAFLSSTGILAFVGNMVVMALIPALGEELCFRGVMQRIFGKMFQNAHVAIWVTAIIFSAIHMQFYGFIPRMLLGAMLGYLYYWSGSLWLSILAHFVNNGFAVLISYLIMIGSLAPETEEIGTGEGSVFFVLVSLVISSALLFLLHKNRVPKSEIPTAE
ncbi:CPBP family intramembrane metalloprotease [Flavobacteriales bacterium]|nr:CPBP family intramembrane metalloprotease [Flavobacteriales bacterium]